ncbi:MAG TPA: type II toxin-antitoxin system PemK/MazF family toxin [Abditibacterium sp.]
MKPGDVVLAELPQRNDFKARPALLLKIAPPYGDFILCGITTQLQNIVTGVDEIIDSSDADFSRSGLKQTSLVRAAYLVTLVPEDVLGKLGEVAPERLARIQRNLARFLESPSIN